MEYTLNLGMWSSVFAVPSSLVDRHIKLAGKEQLQIILWILRHPDTAFSPESLAASLGMNIENASDALTYWVQEGLLCETGGVLTPASAESSEAESPQAPALPPAAADPAPMPAKKRILRTDSTHLVSRMRESESLKYLIQEAESILGKTISPTLSASLLSLCDDYGMPPEILLTILNYAKSIGKTSTVYIESVAKAWASEGISTLEAAEEKLRVLTARRLAWRKLASVAGLSNRSPSKSEEDAAWRWTEEWGFSQDMLAAAYERCADNTGKYSTKYMNTILESWHRQGITTPEQAVNAEEERKGKTEKSYNIDEFEETSLFDLPEGL